MVDGSAGCAGRITDAGSSCAPALEGKQWWVLLRIQRLLMARMITLI